MFRLKKLVLLINTAKVRICLHPCKRKSALDVQGAKRSCYLAEHQHSGAHVHKDSLQSIQFIVNFTILFLASKTFKIPSVIKGTEVLTFKKQLGAYPRRK